MSKIKSSKPKGLIRSGADRKKFLLKSNIILLLALSMMIFIIPVVPIKDSQLTRVLLGIVVVSGLFAADFSRTAFRALFTFSTLVIIVTLLNLVLHDSRVLSIMTFALNTLFFIMVTVALVAHVASAKEVYGSTVLCAVNSYLLIGFTLSLLLLIMDMFAPGSFSELDSGDGSYPSFIYYGFVTLTTLGYGDITPDTAAARSLSTFTALFGQLYLVIIMALIIGKYLKGKKSAE